MSVTMSAETKDLFAAIARAQAKTKPAAKDKVNPHFKNSYADLASMWEACAGPLNEEGCGVLQLPSRTPEGVEITTIITHASGQWIQSTLVMPLDARANAQAVGSAITYGKRYSLPAVSGDDDDGHEASKAAPKTAAKPAAKSKAKGASKEPVPISDCKRAHVLYQIASDRAKLVPRKLSEFLVDALGRPLTDAEVKDRGVSLPERTWEQAMVKIIAAHAEVPHEREPGEDEDDYAAEQDGAA